MRSVLRRSVAPNLRSVTLRSTVVFAGAGILPRGISLVLLPLYTHSMEPAEYGVLSIIVTLISATALVFTLGLDFSVFRGYFARRDSPESQQTYIASLWRFSSLYSFLAAVALMPICLPLTGLVDGLTDAEVAFALLASAVAVAGAAIPLPILRAQIRLRDYLVVTACPTLVSATLSVVGVVVLDGGVGAWLTAYATSTVVGLLVARRIVPWRPTRINWSEVREALRLSLPLMPHFAAYWGLQLADRGLLAGLVSSSALGIYSLASNVALPALVAAQSLSQAFMPDYARAGRERNKQLQRTVSVHFAAVCIAALAIAALGPPIIELLIADSYHQAADLVGWIVLGYAFLGFYSVPMNAAGLGANRTGLAWLASLAGVTANLAGIYLFVPKYGLMAAAVASAGSYAVLLLGTFIWERSGPSPLVYPWPAMAVCLSLALGAYFGIQVTITGHALLDVALGLAWTGGAGLAVLLVVHRLTNTGLLPTGGLGA